MAERIEFVGNPLPTGLPGFGGGTVSVLTLPGFNTVVAVQQFGPVVDAPTVEPPTPTPPPGSNPVDPPPTSTPVPPAPAPPAPSTTFNKNFCSTCKSTTLNVNKPILYGKTEETQCVDCQGRVRTVQFLVPATTEIVYTSSGIRYDGIGRWELDSYGVMLDEDLYEPKELEVCEGGETVTWKVLAYIP